MTVDDEEQDRILASVAGLRTYDVSERRVRRLRRRCHTVLQTPAQPARSTEMMMETPFKRVVAPALAVAWCVAYLVEIVRSAAAVYGLLP